SKRLRKDSTTCNGSNASQNNKGKGPEGGASTSSCTSGIAVGTAGGSSKGTGKNLSSISGEKEEGNKKKARRQWESWSAEDKNSFFEGLYEHGKDFEAIQNNIALKYKKKGKPASMVKNKEQVRHFYYRTWHKISKYIDFNNVFSRGLKKSSQELYGLICYGELRKKIGGCMDDKNAAKLNELIHAGATTVRYKGRNLRIKAPMCRALKKLCDPDGISDEEDQKPVRLPLKVPLELLPRSNYAWARVQSLAQNPRLRMMVELHRKVSSLIEFLKQKWALQEVRIRKALEERLHDCGDGELGVVKPEAELHLFPAENCTLNTLPGVAKVVHSKACCTVHWQETGRCRQSIKDAHLLPPVQILARVSGAKDPNASVRGLESGKHGPSTGEGTQGTEDQQNPSLEATSAEEAALQQEMLLEPLDSVSAAEDCVCGGVVDTDEISLLDPFPRYMKSCRNLVVPEKCLCKDKSEKLPGDTISKTSMSAPLDDGDNTSLSAECSQEQTISCSQEVSELDCPGRRDSLAAASQGQSANAVSKASKDDAAHLAQPAQEECWNLRTAENLTLAEVFLMLGKPSKLQMEYDWVQIERNEAEESEQTRSSGLHTQKLLKCLLQIIATEVNPKPVNTSSVATSPMKLSHEDQTHTPPGKVITLARSPGCVRNAAGIRANKTLSPTTASAGLRNVQKSLVVSCSSGATGTSSNDADTGVFAVPTILPPNSRHNKLFSPNKDAEMSFRQQLDSFSRQPDIYLPKQRKLRNNRPRKPLVVQRTLLPRPTGSSSPHVCSFSILSNSSAAGTGSFRPLQSSLSKSSLARPIVPKAIPAATSQFSSAIDLAAKSAGIIPGSPVRVLETEGSPELTSLSTEAVSIVTANDGLTRVQNRGDPLCPFYFPSHKFKYFSAQRELDKNILQNGLSSPMAEAPSSLFTSPPNVSALLDISLPGPPDDVLSQGGPHSQISDSIIELAINSTQYISDSAPLSPTKLNGSDSSKSLPSPSTSPQRNWIASPTHDPQWYPNDSADSSLGSLLSSLISPEKGRKMLTNSNSNSLLGNSLLDGNSRDSFVSRSLVDVSEVDSQLVCMMNENSVDYIARFNDLAQELSGAEPSRKEILFDSGTPIGDLSQ
uniref:Protein cramped-like n=1 Tax=Callorhinchus milii TaxID=7868 RepID=A0A4W3HY77_CALMI